MGESVTYIQKTPDVCGGVACVGWTRIPVWVLVRFSEIGVSIDQLEEFYPRLNARDIRYALEYGENHKDEIASDMVRNGV